MVPARRRRRWRRRPARSSSRAAVASAASLLLLLLLLATITGLGYGWQPPPPPPPWLRPCRSHTCLRPQPPLLSSTTLLLRPIAAATSSSSSPDESPWSWIDGYGEALRRCSPLAGAPPLGAVEAAQALARLADLGAAGGEGSSGSSIVRDERYGAFVAQALIPTLEALGREAPAALLRLPLHLARLGHPPADLLALGFWPQYLQAASTAAAAAAAWSRLRIDELMAWPAALASLGPDADDESYSSSIDALAAAWLDAALARHHGDGGTPSALSLLQWAGGLEGLSRLHSSAPLSLDPFGPRVGAVLRGLLSGGAADEEDGGGAADAVPQLWAALIWLGWLEGDEEGEQGVIQLLAQAAERGIARYGPRDLARLIDCCAHPARPSPPPSLLASIVEALAGGSSAGARRLGQLPARSHCRLLRLLRRAHEQKEQGIPPAALRALWGAFMLAAGQDREVTAEDTVTYVEDAVALTKRGDWPALPPLLRWAAKRASTPPLACRLLTLVATMSCSPGRGFITTQIVAPLASAADGVDLGVEQLASVLHALATLDIPPPPPHAAGFWRRVAASVDGAADTSPSDLALVLWVAVVLFDADDGRDDSIPAIEAAGRALLEAVSRDPASLLPAARRQALLALTALRLLLPTPPPSTTTTRQLLALLASSEASGAPLGPLPPLPPPSPSKLQASVRAFLVERAGIPPDRVEEEVPSSASLEDCGPWRELDWLGYRIDLLVFPRGEGAGAVVGPLAVEVDGPHHFLLEEGREAGPQGPRKPPTLPEQQQSQRRRRGKKARRQRLQQKQEGKEAEKAVVLGDVPALRPLGPTRLKRRVLAALCPALGWAGLIAVSQREWRAAERAGQERALLEGKMWALGLDPAAYLG